MQINIGFIILEIQVYLLHNVLRYFFFINISILSYAKVQKDKKKKKNGGYIIYNMNLFLIYIVRYKTKLYEN